MINFTNKLIKANAKVIPLVKVVALFLGAFRVAVELCSLSKGSFTGVPVDDDIKVVDVESKVVVEFKWSGTGVTKTAEVSFEAIDELKIVDVVDGTTVVGVEVAATVVELFSSSFLSSFKASLIA